MRRDEKSHDVACLDTFFEGKLKNGKKLTQKQRRSVHGYNICDFDKVFDLSIYLPPSIPDHVMNMIGEFLKVDKRSKTLCHLSPFIKYAQENNMRLSFSFLNAVCFGMPLNLLIKSSEILGFGLTWVRGGVVFENEIALDKRFDYQNYRFGTSVPEPRAYNCHYKNNYLVHRDSLRKVAIEDRIYHDAIVHNKFTLPDSGELVHYVYSDQREVESLNAAIEHVLKKQLNETFEIKFNGVYMNKNSCSEWEVAQTVYVLSKRFFKQKHKNLHVSSKPRLLAKAAPLVEDIKKIWNYFMKDDDYYVAASDHFSVEIQVTEEVKEREVYRLVEQPSYFVEERVEEKNEREMRLPGAQKYEFLRSLRPEKGELLENYQRLEATLPEGATLSMDWSFHLKMDYQGERTDLTDFVFVPLDLKQFEIDEEKLEEFISKNKIYESGMFRNFVQVFMRDGLTVDKFAQCFLEFDCDRRRRSYSQIQNADFYYKAVASFMSTKSYVYPTNHLNNCLGLSVNEIYRYYEQHVQNPSWSSSKKNRQRSSFKREALHFQMANTGAQEESKQEEEPKAPTIIFREVKPEPKYMKVTETETIRKGRRALVPKNLIQSENKMADFIKHTMKPKPTILGRSISRQVTLIESNKSQKKKYAENADFRYLAKTRRHIKDLTKKIHRLRKLRDRETKMQAIRAEKFAVLKKYAAAYKRFDNHRRFGNPDHKFFLNDPDFNRYDFEEINKLKKLILMGGVCWSRGKLLKSGNLLTTKLRPGKDWEARRLIFDRHLLEMGM